MTVRQLPYAAFPASPPRPSQAWRPAILGVRWFVRDFAIVLAVIGVYFLLRGAAPDRFDLSVRVTNRLIAFEQRLHVFWEPENPAVVHPVALVKGVRQLRLCVHALSRAGRRRAWLWFRNRESFLFMRNVMFVSMVIGLVFYYACRRRRPG